MEFEFRPFRAVYILGLMLAAGYFYGLPVSLLIALATFDFEAN